MRSLLVFLLAALLAVTSAQFQFQFDGACAVVTCVACCNGVVARNTS